MEEVKSEKLQTLYSPTESDDEQNLIQKSEKCQKFLKARSEYSICCKSFYDAVKQLRNLNNLDLNGRNNGSEGSQTENIKSVEGRIEKIVKELKTLEEVVKGLYKIDLKDVAGIKSQKPKYRIVKRHADTSVMKLEGIVKDANV